MARFFIGSATHKLDGKGRVSLPSDFRDALRAQESADAFILVPAAEGAAHHLCFSRAGHERLIQRLGALSYPSPAHKRAARRRYIADAKPISVEEGGRFVLARELREGLGLSAQVQFIGDGETFQIWEPGAYAEATAPEPEAPLDPVEIDFAGLVE